MAKQPTKDQLLRRAALLREEAEDAHEDYVQAVLAAHFGGCSQREIGRAVGISGAAVHKLINSRR
jgi:DNA-directed RNA polymerase specialized sigma24 family protein